MTTAARRPPTTTTQPAQKVPRRRNVSPATDEANAEADEGDRIAAEDQAPKPRSVVSADRKKEFKPSDLSVKLTAAVADEKGRTNPEKLKAFAVANGCWQERYEQLNVGMQRMNVGTRLRAKVARGEKVNWRK